MHQCIIVKRWVIQKIHTTEPEKNVIKIVRSGRMYFCLSRTRSRQHPAIGSDFSIANVETAIGQQLYFTKKLIATIKQQNEKGLTTEGFAENTVTSLYFWRNF